MPGSQCGLAIAQSFWRAIAVFKVLEFAAIKEPFVVRINANTQMFLSHLIWVVLPELDGSIAMDTASGEEILADPDGSVGMSVIPVLDRVPNGLSPLIRPAAWLALRVWPGWV